MSDLRLAVPAAAAWTGAAAACTWTGAAPQRLVVAAAAALALAAIGRRLAVAAAAAGLLLGGLSAMLHVAAVRSGPVAALARAGGHAGLGLTLVRDPQPRVSARGSSFVLVDATVTAVGGRGARAPVLVIAHGGVWRDLLPGQRLRVRARLSPPRSSDGISAVVLATGPPDLLGRPPWWQRAAGSVRARLRLACAALPADERGLVPGLVVGDVSAMPPALTAAFRASGLTHLNAVSGENCAIVLAAVAALLRRTPLSRGWRFAVAGASLAAFVVLARPSPSVLRAAVMGAAALAAGALGRRTHPLPLLSAAVLLLVLTDPFLARAPGFALSVLATAAIVLLAPAMTAWLQRWLPRPLAVAVAVPAAAQLACTPVLVAAFGQLTPWAVPANLLAAVAVAPATVAGVITAGVATMSLPAASAVAWAAALPAAWLALVARTMAALPGSRAPTAVDLVAMLATALATMAVGRARRARAARLRAMLGACPP